MIEQIIRAWNRFWFSPACPSQLTALRIAVCTVVCVWFLSFIPHADAWFGPLGLLSATVGHAMIQFEGIAAWQMWSPLWWTDSKLVFQVFSACGALLSLICALGVGGRVSMSLLLLGCIALIHRIVWLSGPIEPAIVAFVGFLIVQPGTSVLSRRSSQSQPSIPTNIVLRLFQTHWWILLAAGVCSQLASFNWWQGDAVWWLAASGRSNLLSLPLLGGKLWLINLLTHAMVASQILALWLISTTVARPLGILFGALACLGIGLIADQLLYAMLMGSCLLAFQLRITSYTDSTAAT